MSRSRKNKLNKIKIKYFLLILALALTLLNIKSIKPAFMRYYYEITGEAVGIAKVTPRDPSEAVEINGKYYTSINDAIKKNAIVDDVETTVNVLTDLNENIIFTQKMNIKLNLNKNTISNANANAVITNNGKLEITNGNITSKSTTNAAINNEATGTIVVGKGSKISMTIEGGRQAMYNRGNAKIEENAELYSASTIRASVQNISGGKLIITSGKIHSTGFSALVNAGTLTIGIKDGNVDTQNPMFKGGKNDTGKCYGIESTSKFDFYDGIVNGIDDAFSDRSKIQGKEELYHIIYNNKEIDSMSYVTAYLSISEVVTFDTNGGTECEKARGVEKGEKIGKLPTTTKLGHTFDGWYTLLEGGTKVTEDTIVTENITLYAHWTPRDMVVSNGKSYTSLQTAISNAPNNIQTTIKLIQDIEEAVVISSNKNIILDLNNHELNTNLKKQAVIKNNGTIEIKNGTITSSSENGAVDNEATGKMILNGVKITIASTRQALFNNGGTVEIKGNSYLSSCCVEAPTTEGVKLQRGTVQNVNNGTLIITGGTIICETQNAVSSEGKLIIGTKDEDASTLLLRGNCYGVEYLGTFEFYDGTLEGITGACSNTITKQPDNTQIIEGQETIDGKTYKTIHLEPIE